jgi:hypothetical protein
LLNNVGERLREGRGCKPKGASEMPKYLYVYHGGGNMAAASREEQDKAMQAWMGWFGQLGKSVVDGGNPVGKSTTVESSSVKNNGGANPVSGYSIVEAANVDDAVAKAKGCPILHIGGSVEVAEILPM